MSREMLSVSQNIADTFQNYKLVPLFNAPEEYICKY